MSEVAVAPRPYRTWLGLAALGCALVTLAFLVTILVIVDKPHFGWLVGSMFLPVMTGGLFVGAFLLLLGTWNLPIRGSWRGVFLMVWGLVALTSPLFGYLFLAPWLLLAVTLPAVVTILWGLRAR